MMPSTIKKHIEQSQYLSKNQNDVDLVHISDNVIYYKKKKRNEQSQYQ